MVVTEGSLVYPSLIVWDVVPCLWKEPGKKNQLDTLSSNLAALGDWPTEIWA